MKTPFPIFVDLETVPPLVIGTAENLVAKIRLLLKFAPVVDVITDGAALPHLYQMPNVCRIVDMSYDAPKAQLEAHIKGRPLIIVETLDDKRDAALSAIARGYGVPVNIPDTPALCSFYLGSIVDRAPVTVAISTSGMAPVLGQICGRKLKTCCHRPMLNWRSICIGFANASGICPQLCAAKSSIG
jgi:uroporphyrin-III C-methyltransferase / precorrin-2 dehydrogenase / sirohydrochlorin ferrochelatase